MDVVTRELRDRDTLMAEIVEWVRAEHADVVQDAGSHTRLVRLLRGPTGRSMSTVWALCDYLPADGGPPLMARFAAADGLDPAKREIALGLAGARQDVYRVEQEAAGATVGLRSLSSGATVDVFAGDGLERLEAGDTLVARIAHTTSIATAWGRCARFDGRHERRWRACLAALPDDRQAAALTLLQFHPDDVAEPLPDDLALHTATLRVDDDELLVEELEDDGALECLGECIEGGWAFAWLGDATSGSTDLGGWDEDGTIEVARVIVRPPEVVIASGDRGTLGLATSHLEHCVRDRLSRQPGLWAA